jgi:phage virion morphogenesis protein
MRLTVELDRAELETYGRAIGALGARGQALDPLLDSIGQGLEASVRERFAETNEAPDGTPWQPSIRAALEGGRTLVQSGNLSDSITHAVAGDAVAVGTNVLYAAVHQQGMRIEAKDAKALRFRVGERWVSKQAVEIPARPFIGLSDDDEAMILGEATDFLSGAFGGAA